jgi:hypothetical protein
MHHNLSALNEMGELLNQFFQMLYNIQSNPVVVIMLKGSVILLENIPVGKFRDKN